MLKSSALFAVALCLVSYPFVAAADHVHPDMGIVYDGGHNPATHNRGYNMSAIVPEGAHSFDAQKHRYDDKHWGKHHHHGIQLEGGH